MSKWGDAATSVVRLKVAEATTANCCFKAYRPITPVGYTPIGHAAVCTQFKDFNSLPLKIAKASFLKKTPRLKKTYRVTLLEILAPNPNRAGGKTSESP